LFKIRHLIAVCIFALAPAQARAIVIPVSVTTFSDAAYTTAASTFSDGDTAYVLAGFLAAHSPGALTSTFTAASLTEIQLTGVGAPIVLLSGGSVSTAGLDRSFALGGGMALPVGGGTTIYLGFSYEIDAVLDPGPAHSLTVTGFFTEINTVQIGPSTATLTQNHEISNAGALLVEGSATAISAPGGIALMIGGLAFVATRRQRTGSAG